MSDYVMVYEHAGKVTTLPKPPPQETQTRALRTIGFLIRTLHHIILTLQKAI